MELLALLGALCIVFTFGFLIGRETKTEIKLMGDLHIKNQHGPINLNNAKVAAPAVSDKGVV